MLLAAGRGERMRPLTDQTPKPLLRVHGKPLIDYHIERLAQAGIERIVINLSWLGGMIRAHCGDGSRYGVPITYSEEGARPLETAGGVFRALPQLLPGPFLVVNGDIFTDFPFGQAALASDRHAHVVLAPNPPHHPNGDFGLEQGLALETAPVRYTFTGISLYRPQFFANCVQGAFALKPLLLRSIAAQRCSAQLYRGLWQDVGTAQRLEALNS